MKKDKHIVIWDDNLMKGYSPKSIADEWRKNKLKHYAADSVDVYEGAEIQVRFEIMEKIQNSELFNDPDFFPRIIQVESIYDR